MEKETQVEERVTLLRLQVEAAELEDKLGQLRAPRWLRPGAWWRRPGLVTGMVAVVAASAPITTGILGYYQRQRELLLEQSKLQDTINGGWMERLRGDPVQRAMVLRFISKTANDQSLRAWAAEETQHADVDVEELRRREAEQRARAENAERESAEKDRMWRGARDEDERARLAAEASRARQRSAAAQAQLARIQEKLDPLYSSLPIANSYKFSPAGDVGGCASGTVIAYSIKKNTLVRDTALDEDCLSVADIPKETQLNDEGFYVWSTVAGTVCKCRPLPVWDPAWDINRAPTNPPAPSASAATAASGAASAR